MSTEAPPQPGSIKLPRPLEIFLLVALLLLVGALACEAISILVLNLRYPYMSPLLFEHFPDLLTMRPRFDHFHTLQFFTDVTDPPCMYPAPVAICYRLFFLFVPHELAVYLAFCLAAFAVTACLFGKKLHRSGLRREEAALFTGFALVTSYPAWFVMKQANLEICPWVLLMIGMWCYYRGKGYSAAVCFGLAGALKITPFVYLGLFLARRQYRHIAVALGAAAAVTIPSLWLVYPHVLESWRLTNAAVAQFRTVVTLGMFPQVGFDHSIFGLIKQISFLHLNLRHRSMLLTLYSAAVLPAIVLLYWWKIRKLPVINQVMCLCLITMLAPPTSFDYTLLNLYLPWGLLVLYAIKQARRTKPVAGLILAMVCFAILFVPETEFILHQMSLGGQIKALTLITLLVIALRYPFPLDGENETVRYGAVPLPL